MKREHENVKDLQSCQKVCQIDLQDVTLSPKDNLAKVSNSSIVILKTFKGAGSCNVNKLLSK